MFRKRIFTEIKQQPDPIGRRGEHISRLEAFSDAVFAFSITLLIVALEVPDTYEKLMESMSHFFSFGICFAILLIIWNSQNIYFRRYGLNDGYSVALNGCLLFTCLFFVYPLKFLFSVFPSVYTPGADLDQAQNLYYIYNAGFMGIYLLFGLLYRHALHQRKELGLTEQEAFHTESQMITHFLIAATGIAPITFAMLGEGFIVLAPVSYVLIWPVTAIGDRRRNKLFKRKFSREEVSEEAKIEVV